MVNFHEMKCKSPLLNIYFAQPFLWPQIRFNKVSCYFLLLILDSETYFWTGTIRLANTYKYILTLLIMSTQQLPVLHWMNNFLIQNFILQRSTMFLLFRNYLLIKVMHLMIICSKRSRSRTAATSKMEPFVIKVNGF